MGYILIPDIKKIASVTAKTIDRFASLAEAISVTEDGRSCIENVSILSLCRTIMIELGATKTDVDSLFDILQNVILTLVSDTCSGCCRTKETDLPDLTKLQKEVLCKFVTFDKLLVKELEMKVKTLRQLVKQHKKIRANEEKYRREVANYEKNLAILQYQLHGSTPMKTRLLYFLQMKRDRVQKNLTRAKSASRINADLERTVSSQIENLSDDIFLIVSDKILDRLGFGMEYCLYDIISKMNVRENKMKTVDWVKHLDLPDIVLRLVTQYSETYVTSENNAHEELTLEDVSSYTGSSGESAGSDDKPTVVEEITIDSSSGEIKLLKPSCGGEFCRRVGFCNGPGNYEFKKGILRREMTEAKVKVKRNADRWAPGFIDIKPGMAVHQTATGIEDNDVGFGYYRPTKWGAKQWGFYYLKPTQ